jgi:hypothetical protein
VVLAGKAAIGLAHLLLGGAAGDAKDIVVALASHGSIVERALPDVNLPRKNPASKTIKSLDSVILAC